jgi:Pyruvate decarboxylase and related thiamine pyrophosphate-requiring enzymes
MLFLSSCVSLKRAICDCNQQPKPVPAHAEVHVEKPVKPVKLVKKKKTPTQESIIVDDADIELSNKMTSAVDTYVFKDDEDEFKKLCSESRFDCWVNEKKYPAKKKAIARTIPPFLTGSKMGLRGDERIQVRFNFYP